MNNKKAEKLYYKAIDAKNESEGLLSEAVKEIARKKGFIEENVLLFDACFASGDETIITFNGEGEMYDTGIELFDSMTKEEFVDWFTRRKELSEESVKLLESEL